MKNKKKKIKGDYQFNCKHLTAKAILKTMPAGTEIQCGCGGILKK